jgi:hypothetical protein
MVDARAQVVCSPEVGDSGQNTIAQLREIHYRLAAKIPLDETQSHLLAEGIGSYLDAVDEGRTPSLDRAMGLIRHGGISPVRQDHLARRDLLLRHLWRVTPEWTSLSASVVARLMVQSAKRYEAVRWEREQFRPQPATQPAATWWQILSIGLKIPGSKRLQQILDEEIQDRV